MKGDKVKKFNLFKSKKITIIISFIIVILIIFSLYWIFFSECNKFPEEYEMDDVVICYYRSTMIGRFDIVIYGNGSAYYLSSYDQDNLAKTGNLSTEDIQEIIDIIKKNGFYCLDDNYDFSVMRPTDAGTDYVSITIGGKTKKVEDYGRNAPSSFKEILDKIKSSVENLPDVTEEKSDEFCNVISKNTGLGEIWCLTCVNMSISNN